MHKLAELCVKRPVFATVLILSLVVVGWFAYQQLGVDRFPKVDIPTITITTRLVGAAPEEIETDISDKIEEAVNTISGVDELQSISSEGTSQVIVSFVLEKDIEVAAQEVRDKVNTILRDLPKDADPRSSRRSIPTPSPSSASPSPGPRRSATSPSSPTRSCAAVWSRSTASARRSSSAGGRGRSTSSPTPRSSPRSA